jgi:hypothetical protein
MSMKHNEKYYPPKICATYFDVLFGGEKRWHIRPVKNFPLNSARYTARNDDALGTSSAAVTSDDDVANDVKVDQTGLVDEWEC